MDRTRSLLLSLCHRATLAFIFLSFLSVGAPLPAQPPPGPEEEPPLSSVFGDGGSTTDPSLPAELWTLGDDLLPYDGDPNSLDSEDLYPPELLGTDPDVPADPTISATGCGNITQTITPIKIGKTTAALPFASRYFSYRNTIQTLVGVSADNGCHLELSSDKCNWTNYPTTIQAAFEAGLNKLRLWIALAGEKNPNNVPFLYCPSAVASPDCANFPANAYPFWRLDKPNTRYFQRLRDVVAYAQDPRKMIVEVTIFAPFEGDFFSQGPWGGKGMMPKSDGTFETVKFSKPEYFVTHDTRGTQEALTNERMRVAQAKVIEWTVQELWCFDTVYWEIANEPEAQTVDPLEVAKWQRDMIAQVTFQEAKYPRLAAGGHLVAVQPFTTKGAGQFIGNPDVGGKSGTRAHTNGALTEKLAEPARAEAWEFLFDQGATYDHFGYLSGGDPNTPATIRRQLGVLKKFVNALPLGRLTSSRSAWSGGLPNSAARPDLHQGPQSPTDTD
ncbi:MAG: hypothetical protein ABJC13_14670 [Acidobacteriota bacterium]